MGSVPFTQLNRYVNEEKASSPYALQSVHRESLYKLFL